MKLELLKLYETDTLSKSTSNENKNLKIKYSWVKNFCNDINEKIEKFNLKIVCNKRQLSRIELLSYHEQNPYNLSLIHSVSEQTEQSFFLKNILSCDFKKISLVMKCLKENKETEKNIQMCMDLLPIYFKYATEERCCNEINKLSDNEFMSFIYSPTMVNMYLEIENEEKRKIIIKHVVSLMEEKEGEEWNSIMKNIIESRYKKEIDKLFSSLNQNNLLKFQNKVYVSLKSKYSKDEIISMFSEMKSFANFLVKRESFLSYKENEKGDLELSFEIDKKDQKKLKNARDEIFYLLKIYQIKPKQVNTNERKYTITIHKSDKNDILMNKIEINEIMFRLFISKDILEEKEYLREFALSTIMKEESKVITRKRKI